MVMPCDRESQDSDRGNAICADLTASNYNCYHKVKNFLFRQD